MHISALFLNYSLEGGNPFFIKYLWTSFVGMSALNYKASFHSTHILSQGPQKDQHVRWPAPFKTQATDEPISCLPGYASVST